MCIWQKDLWRLEVELGYISGMWGSAEVGEAAPEYPADLNGI